ncbi:PREDICTED: keratin-associated protein 27-1 [Chinchilla lanigera]|uniref:keratin-associated protein 27-1 n=1 Tax=Chinchilla lanigera TaxID=34839 RepID=UPI00038ED434|nr:PREDICTED: keratin-associated protein 27-1 [Chinchilla lanigera]
MPHSYCQSLRSSYNPPLLSAIVHGSNLTSCGDGICLPSTCHRRTWLLDNFQEARNETTSCQLTGREQDHLSEDTRVESSCLSRVVQTTRSNSEPSEKTSCQSRSSRAVSENVSQSCHSGSSQQVSFGAQRSHIAQCCPLKTSVSQSDQNLEYESSQHQCQISESSSCNLLVNVSSGPQLPESSSTYEPACCVIGGLQLPSK